MAYDLHASLMFLCGNDRLNIRRNFVRKLNDVYIVSNNRVRFVQIAVEKYLFDGFFTQHFYSSKVPS
jgi:hypothetical protein